jgi:hypothetical protein
MIDIKDFGGMYPARPSAALPGMAADYVLDADLSSNSLKPFRTDQFVESSANAKVLYEVEGCCILKSDDACVSFARGAPSPSCHEIIVKSGNFKPQFAPFPEACANTWRDLSFPHWDAPTVVAPPVPAQEARREKLWAIYTVVDDLGRESGPSFPSEPFEVMFGNNLLISGFPTAYPKGKKIRIYLSRPNYAVGSEATNVEEGSGFYLAKEIPIGSASTVVDVAFPGDMCLTWDYTPAPDNLWGITDFRGNILFGISGNALRHCIPNTYHAWPDRYTIQFYGQAQLFVAGKTMGYVLTNEAPMAVTIPAGCTGGNCMGATQLTEALPLVSRRGAAMYGDTVIYPTHDGLVALTGVQWNYFPHWDRDSWQELMPDQMIGAVHDGAYFGSTPRGTFRLDLRNKDPLRSLVWISAKPTAMHGSDMGRLLYADSTGIHNWNRGADRRTAIWRRKTLGRSALRAYSYLQVIGSGSTEVTIYGDGVPVDNETIIGDSNTRFFPSRNREWGSEISTKSEVVRVIIGDNETQRI